MRLIPIFLLTNALLFNSVQGQDCGCESYSGHSSMTLGSCAPQLYPYDQQDPWLHGQYQRVPSYGGYNSFRPHNYRHVVPQGQIAANWGATQGLIYSHQFYNHHRGRHLNGALHSSAQPTMLNFRPVSLPKTSPPQQNTAAASPTQQQRR